MHKKEIKRSSGKKYSEALGFGVLSGFLVMIIAAFLISFLISKEVLDENILEGSILFVSALGALLGGIVASKLYGSRFLLTGFLTGGCLLLIRLLCSAVNSFGCLFDPFSLKQYAVLLLCGSLSVLFLRKKRPHRRH